MRGIGQEPEPSSRRGRNSKPASRHPSVDARHRLSFRVDEIPDFTGVPRNTVEEALRSGELPCSRINHKVRIVKCADIERWLDSYRSVPADEATIERIKRRRGRHHSERWLTSRMKAKEAQAEAAFDQLEAGS